MKIGMALGLSLLSFIVNASEEILLEGRPAAIDEEWTEVINSKINGKYHFTYQGAIFDTIEYTTLKGLKFEFKQSDYDHYFAQQ